MMNFNDETVEKVANRLGNELYAHYGFITSASYNSLAQAALSSLTLADLMQVDEVRELVEAGVATVNRWDSPSWKDVPHTANYIHALRDRLTPFTEAK